MGLTYGGLDAALAILKSEGLEAVTMRRVAAALDTGAASLNVYVSGPEGLLKGMQDRIIATVELEAPDPSPWRAQLHALLARVHRALVAHPGIAETTMAKPPGTEATLRLLENLLAILLAGGPDPQDAAWAAGILAMVVNYAAIEGDLRRADRQEQAVSLYQTSPAFRATGFPWSPPTPQNSSLAIPRSASAWPSMSSSTACSPEQPVDDPPSGKMARPGGRATALLL